MVGRNGSENALLGGRETPGLQDVEKSNLWSLETRAAERHM